MDQVHAIQHRQSVLAGVQHAHGMPGIAQSVLGIGAPGHPVQNKYGKQYVSPQAGFNMARQSPLPCDVRFLPISKYLLELASGLSVLECGVLTCRGA